jgi:hypothetical protein
MTDRMLRPIRRFAIIVAAAAVIAALSSSRTPAQTLTDPYPKPSAPPPATTKSRPTAHVKNCSIYGPGFMAMPRTDTCIKIGGGVTVEGTSRH